MSQNSNKKEKQLSNSKKIFKICNNKFKKLMKRKKPKIT